MLFKCRHLASFLLLPPTWSHAFITPTFRSTASHSHALSSSQPSRETDIYNCHIHLNHKENVPPGFPNPIIHLLGQNKYIANFLVRFLKGMIPWASNDMIERYADFFDHATKGSQKELFDIVKGHYPNGTRFAVLPMDLRGLDKGQPKQNITAQHLELANLVNENKKLLIPFVHIDPRSGSHTNMKEPIAIEFIRNLTQKGLNGIKFKGIKLYPGLGYSPKDKCVDEIFKYANQKKLPVTVHCMSRGVWTKTLDDHKRIPQKTLIEYTAPSSYASVLRKYPNMRLCLAHFGGIQQWDAYTKGLKIPRSNDVPLEKMNWVDQIITMMKSGDFPNLYTDISYTFFRVHRYGKDLRKLLEEEPRVRSRVLFGSDYYMSEQEKMKEENLTNELNSTLGDELWRSITNVNPKKFLAVQC